MDEKESQAINRRVAEALGWSGLESAESYIAEVWPDGLPIGEGRDYWLSHGGWFGWPPTARRYDTEAGKESPDKEPVPDFCRDAGDAALVLAEIERRGRKIGFTISTGDYCAGIWKSEDACDLRVSSVSPWHALCLAFLAAHEATQAT